MLESLWADIPGRRCIVGMKGKNTQHYWFDTTEAAMAKAVELDTAGWNVYFAPAIFDPAKVEAKRQEINPRTQHHYSGREQSTAHALPALWLDLDCGEGKDYPDQLQAAQAFHGWLQTTGVAAPSFIVSSGYGLHVYWKLDRPVPHDQWLPVAKHLKQACRVHDLKTDPARTSDAASLLRPPGTHNYKRQGPMPVTVLVDNGTAINLQQFRASLPMVGPLGAVPASTPSGEWDVSVKHPPGDANKIADKCQQMGQMRFHKGALPEPQWRAGLSILWRCEDGDILIHDWSSGDERYDPDQTRDKAAGTLGPATCRHFAELNPEGCAGCPHAGTIASPISLAYAESMPEVEGEDAGPLKVPGYTVTKEGIFMEPAADGGPLTKIADFPVWIEEARELAMAHENVIRATLILSWEDVRGRRYHVPITQAELHDTRQWTAWLANNNLASFVHGPQMATYISKMHKVRYRERGARIVYDSLGWYRGQELFVTGCQGVTATGSEDIIVDAKGPLADLKAQGTLEAWREAVKVLGKVEYRPHAFALLAGFAAPLLELAGKDGAVVALVGRSGKGKTLAAETALSIFGEPRKLRNSGRSTNNELGMYLGQMRHVPALVDEVTSMKAHYLRDLIYMAANGADKGALNQKRERRTIATWRTVTLLTSNHSILDQHQSVIEEAHRRRLIEIAVLEGVSKEDGSTLADAILANHGLAAVPYLQLVMQHKAKIPALFEVVERQVERWGYDAPEDRFGMWTCAAALLGGILAYVAGVLPFDPLPVVRDVCKAAVADNGAIMSPEDMAHDTLFEMLVTHSKRICMWTGGKLAVDDTDNPIARIDGRTLYVRSTEFNETLHEAHIYKRALDPWFARMAPQGGRNIRLAPGTPPVWAYAFDMDALDWDQKSLKGE